MSGDSTDDTDTCTQCEAYRDRCSEPNLLVVHTRREVICAGKKKPPLALEKKKIRQHLEKIVSALRNTEGGQIVVHIDGQRQGDKYLEHFDELISGSFSDLIEDGQLYIEAYNRQWLSGVKRLESFENAVLIIVARSHGISTVDFNTRINNDIENKNPSSLTIAEILFKQDNPRIAAPRLRGLPDDVQLLHENRSVEIKSLLDERRLGGNTGKLVDYIWTDLKLKENLTSLSKVTGGGSYYVGISEGQENGDYRTKTPNIDGFRVTNPVAVIEGIKTKVKENILVLKDGAFNAAPDDFMHIEFYKLSKTSPQRYVLEVAVRYFNGVVFCDKKGPRTYKIQDDQIIRVDKEEWLKRFMERFESCVRHAV